MNTKANIPLTKEGIEIVKNSQQALCIVLKGKFGCTAVIHNVDVPTTSSSGSVNLTTMFEMKYCKQVVNGLKISVWKDDLTVHKVDAVVNAANEYLSHGGGLALALSKAGGPQIQQMSDQVIHLHGRVPTGQVAVTLAGNLPCKRIIHAVGPCVSRNPAQSELDMARPLLEKAIWSILQLSEYNNLQSVAIPALSSGLYNFPLRFCADIIVKTVKMFGDMRTAPGRSLDVRLVNNDDPSVQEMQRACREILGPSDHMEQWDKSVPRQISAKAPTSSPYPSLDLGNMTLFIKTGAIEEEAADVIVNTVGRDLCLSVGQISNAILNKAGPKMQGEIQRHRIGFASDGDVFKTGPYMLRCKAVFHTVCAEKGSSSSADKILHSVVKRCLSMASKQFFSSISFPAIGTGSLGFRSEDVSKIMINAVKEFSSTYRGKKMDVYFVIFSKDTFRAFEQEVALLESATISSPTGKSSAFDDSEDSGRTPCIELFTNSPEALREAQAWAVRMLHMHSTSAEVKNNLIVHFGQEDHTALMNLQATFNVVITEFFRKGKCGILIIGGASVAISSAAIHVESMLCQAQDYFAQIEEEDLLHSVVRWEGLRGSEGPRISAALEKAYLACADTVSVNGKTFKLDLGLGQAKNEQGQYEQLSRMCFYSLYSKMPKLPSQSYYERTPIDLSDSADKERQRKYAKCGLKIVKVEKMENYALKQLFELNRERVTGKPQWLYQCVRAQFCDQICRVGFQREYAPPEEQGYGAGIYFTTEMKRALELWEDRSEEFIYIIEAQVLTGKSIKGSPELIVPPPTGSDPLDCYNSVTSDLKDIYVIFHSQQALPQFLITCTKILTV
ncbi:hypothetical protein P4O66_008022 [Electrophorus voltai]|uniref:Poly [ADP-ribose] polymerase n=1 Tax=Electrophorus voltai TaxID=2609070 RepID=A0AAD9DXJ2_9TELE|nr:hypothetical protein P4O66_008022 [Electrophorus voltai]